MKKQYGMLLLGFLLATGVLLAMLAIRLTPAYLEYFAVKRIMVLLAHDAAFPRMSRADMITTFQKRADSVDIHSVEVKDLAFLRDEDGRTALSVDYQVSVPVVSNVSILLDFEASTDDVR